MWMKITDYILIHQFLFKNKESITKINVNLLTHALHENFISLAMLISKQTYI